MKRSFQGLEYDYIDPTGNITILVTTPVGKSDRARTASDIMKYEAACEQVGYVTDRNDKGIDICMAADEFCGNAVMSAAALFCDDNKMGKGDELSVTVRCSGCDRLLQVYITRKSDDDTYHVYGGRVEMPLPEKIRMHTFEHDGTEYTLPIVEFDGISHIIAGRDEIAMDDKTAESVIKKWCHDLNEECAGLMIIENGKTEGDTFSAGIRPVVYVPAVGTCFWESSCASGTTAAFCHFAKDTEKGIKRLIANEPGGTLTVSMSDTNTPLLEGTVRL